MAVGHSIEKMLSHELFRMLLGGIFLNEISFSWSCTKRKTFLNEHKLLGTSKDNKKNTVTYLVQRVQYINCYMLDIYVFTSMRNNECFASIKSAVELVLYVNEFLTFISTCH